MYLWRNDKTYHGSASSEEKGDRSMNSQNQGKKSYAPSGRIKALDELLDLPHLDVLLRNVLTHRGQRRYQKFTVEV